MLEQARHNKKAAIQLVTRDTVCFSRSLELIFIFMTGFVASLLFVFFLMVL